MAAADRQRWDRRHAEAAAGRVPGGRGPARPRPFLVEAAAWLPAAGSGPSGEAGVLDLAGGSGAEAVWLADRGLRVDLVDVSPVGLAQAEAAARHAGVGALLQVHEHDLDVGLPPACRGPYRLVCALHVRTAALDRAIATVLAPAGLVVATRLSIVGRAVAPAPARVEPHRDDPDRDAPDRDAPDRDAPDRDAPDRDAPDRDAPDRGPGRRGAGRVGGPDPAFLAAPGELLDLAGRHDLEVLRHVEGGGWTGLVARAGGHDAGR